MKVPLALQPIMVDLRALRRTARNRWARFKRWLRCVSGDHEGHALRSRWEPSVVIFYCDYCDFTEEHR